MKKSELDNVDSGRLPLSLAKRMLFEKRLRGEPLNVSTKQQIPVVLSHGDGPLSFAQRQLWLIDQLTPGIPTYHIPRVFRLQGLLNIGMLEWSVNEIVRRHEILRTTFVAVKGGLPKQVIHPVLEVPLSIIDLQKQLECEREIEIQQLGINEVRRPFDLANGPLLRTTLLQLGKDEYVLFLNFHHIIFDGWSEGLFFRELTELYQARVNGKSASLPDLRIQYADYTIWQREFLQGNVLESQLTYWKQKLQGIPPLLELPIDRQRPSTQSFDGAVYSFALPQELSEKLKKLGRQEQITLFMLLLAVFQVLLSRYSGKADIVVGTPISNRSQKETEGLIGFFVNTLIMRAQLADDLTFRELLKQVRETALSAYAHQDLPFEKLVEELHPERSLSYSPIFNVMFVFQNTPDEELSFLGMELERLRFHSGTAKFDLTLSMKESDAGLVGSVEYSVALFDESTIAQMALHYQILLESAVADPERRISELPMLSEEEQNRILVEWNDTKTEYPQDKYIHELFEDQVERTPNAIAIVFEGQQLTYQELNTRANQLAHYLRTLEVGPGVLVGICVERSIEMMVGILGIIKAGGAYVPLDPMYPKERLAYMVEDAGLSVLLTQDRLCEELPVLVENVIRLDTDWQKIEQESKENLVNKVMPNNLIYIIYTSGTTGKPKGSGVYHRSFVNLLNWFIHDFELTAKDRVLLITSLSFDLTQKNLYAPLITGGELHLLSTGYYDAAKIVRLVCDHAITWINCVPSAFYSLVAYNDNSIEMQKTLRYVFLGGEPISLSKLSNWADAHPWKTQIVNTYGPTECSDICASYRINSHELPDTNVPIGKPIDNTKLYILDHNLAPVPVNVLGELYIAGDGVGLGYLSQPGLTAEKFVPNPFSLEPGARMYKTGDQAHYFKNGNIEFIGRIDHQVKIRGFRVELGEVESVIEDHPGVNHAAVVVREDTPGDKRLVAYFVPKDGVYITPLALGKFVANQVPNYMVPSAFVILGTLPLSPNGKIDRKALSALEVTWGDEDRIYEAPQTSVEETLIKIWSETLGLKKVGVHDDIFELGAHSLKIIELGWHINQCLEIDLPLRLIFEIPTIAGLGAYIEKYLISNKSSSEINILETPVNNVIVIKRGNPELEPIFLIPPTNGAHFFLSRLGTYLEKDRSVYLLAYPGFSDETSALTTIGEMATSHIQSIRQIHPQGNFSIVGFSDGGTLAFEIARMLEKQGDNAVDLLVFLDTMPPSVTKRLAMQQIETMDTLQELMGFDEASRKENHYLSDKSLKILKQYSYSVYDLFKISSKNPNPRESKHLVKLIETITRNNRALFDYQFSPIRTRIIVFEASEFSGGHGIEKDEADMQEWANCTLGGLLIVPIPGDHGTMLFKAKNARYVAKKIKELLHHTTATRIPS